MSSGSASHQRPGSISVSRRWVGRPSSSRIRPSRRSTGSGGPSRSTPARRWRAARVGRRGSVGGVPVASSGVGGSPGRSSDVGVGGRTGRASAVLGRGSQRGGQPPQVAGPVEPDQDLAEQPLEARRLAARLERLDRGLGHGPGGLRGGERPPVDPLGRREQAARPGTTSGSPAPPGTGSRPTLPRVRAPGGSRPRGWSSSTTGGRRVVGVGQPRAEQPVAGGRGAEHGRDERLDAAVDELDDPSVAGHRPARARSSARRAPPPASSTAAGARHRRGPRSAAAWPPRDRAPRPWRGRRPRAVRGSAACGGWPRTSRIRGVGAVRP